MGENGLHVAVDHRGCVHAGQQGRVEIGRHTGCKGREIGAHIGLGRDLERQELAVLVHRHLGVADVVPSVGVGDEAFRTLRRPLDRTVDLRRGPGDDRFLGVVIDLRAEAAAHIRSDDPQLVLRDREHERAHQQPDHMGVLAGGVERVAVVRGVVFTDCGPRFHRVRDQPVVDDIDLGDMGGAGEHLVHLGLVTDFPVVAEVGADLVMHQRAVA